MAATLSVKRIVSLRSSAQILSTIPVLVCSVIAYAQRPVTIEGLPDRIQARIEVRNRAAANTPAAHANGMQYFMLFTKRWPHAADSPITVAFLGGTDSLRKQIADTASEWSNYGSLKFDFIDQHTGKYREWARSDTAFNANIRVAFDGVDGGGYWSLVGTDSSEPTVIAPNEASLELQGFDSDLPQDWQGTVRHEFGHALGLMHEHAMPVGGCDQDFKWEDDPGYQPTQDSYGQYIHDLHGRKPGIYTMLAGAPNFWSKDKVDANMRQLAADSHNYDFGPFDNMSIMKYYFDAKFFRDGTHSHCYSDENIAISADDQIGIRKWYPQSGSAELSHIQQVQAGIIKSLSDALNVKAVQSLQTIQ